MEINEKMLESSQEEVWVDRPQSLFYFVPQESHSQAGSTSNTSIHYYLAKMACVTQVVSLAKEKAGGLLEGGKHLVWTPKSTQY